MKFDSFKAAKDRIECEKYNWIGGKRCKKLHFFIAKKKVAKIVYVELKCDYNNEVWFI